jgi:1-acyl-sn-glycerol-3-phosphate acyltransferase
MLRQIRGIVVVLAFVVNFAMWGGLFLIVMLFRFVPGAGGAIGRRLRAIFGAWTRGNDRVMDRLLDIAWDVRGVEGLSPAKSYLIAANHQSYLDVPVIERFLSRRIPFIKFFAKRELLFVPVIGVACWALEMPLVRRHSSEYLSKHPEMRGKDLETTMRACRSFGRQPEALLNFVEGTRFDEDKRAKQSSPFRYLLKPKTGGVSFVLAAVGDRLDTLLDVTIVYRSRRRIFWKFCTGENDRIVFEVVQREIPAEFRGQELIKSPELAADFRRWLEGLWREKDERIGRIRAERFEDGGR